MRLLILKHPNVQLSFRAFAAKNVQRLDVIQTFIQSIDSSNLKYESLLIFLSKSVDFEIKKLWICHIHLVAASLCCYKNNKRVYFMNREEQGFELMSQVFGEELSSNMEKKIE